ncbi:hypothetical protein ORJ04_10440 [Rheinheimera baltica]|uniref:Uncharacterized protein n=2 Tax=Rheinheimera baltica TaxID=67576 RepID=A0ABT9HZ21_9GAMM|nr:hypothetical protein [Rheinheimera baltica]MDP5136367.1 hypothetical protein [Rheinheimera baltica]MDP5144186.1 hypothetical protein [Rheinheimera baltica]MDP5149006.1 hypothetical protein [Rheinheimera baltica]
MTKLDKDLVVAEFTAAYKAAFGKAPQLEQKPGWFSVDGGKNIRLAELAELGASYTPTKKASPVAAKQATAPKAAPKPAKAVKVKSTGNGQSAAAMWAQRNGSAQRAPRGCR